MAGLEDQAAYKEFEFSDRTYYGAVSAMDREIGRLRETLQQQGLAENTVVWFASDNGPEGLRGLSPGETGGLRERKRSLYEGGIRVPGIVEWPAQIKAGSTSLVPAVTSDILPTVLALAGAEQPPRAIDGLDLGAVLVGKQQARNSPIGFESGYGMVWSDDRYKLIYIPEAPPNRVLAPPAYEQNSGTEFPFELYDLLNDPGETNNIADEFPEIVRRMSGELKRWRTSVGFSIGGDEDMAIKALLPVQ